MELTEPEDVQEFYQDIQYVFQDDIAKILIDLFSTSHRYVKETLLQGCHWVCPQWCLFHDFQSNENLKNVQEYLELCR